MSMITFMRGTRELIHKLADDHVEFGLRELDLAEQRAGLGGERLCQASAVSAAASSVDASAKCFADYFDEQRQIWTLQIKVVDRFHLCDSGPWHCPVHRGARPKHGAQVGRRELRKHQ
jgi:hypothetical protein